ncbi:NADP-dependent 3-hydroxy acid dehydrogenase YdfG [Lentibacillus persicus]|uniref:NADP-dependent 3-hydroxy acid dehydrogenase YdfG n=1 Tax=Lentibacillus persicus TaxID=640948 RepID=A0A1I1X3G4_9BACI|nr:SDR family oxidoreductase [Lentibacillus persicus]SFE01965.1 NADP-dependent 3-hydroxy acid dehydrogenase YdfG [Lentibacillus persicus]
MALPTKNKSVVLITGASSGFGLLMSLAFAEAGYFVIASMRHLTKKEFVLKPARDKGVEKNISCMKLDITHQEEIDSVVPEIIECYGGVDILINNAGYAAGGFVEEVPLEDWRGQFETNVFGLIALTKAILPHMRRKKHGTIINLSSVSGKMALPGLAPYASSKFAVEGFSEALRLEMLPYGVHVVLIEPGSYQTDIWSKGMNELNVRPDSPYNADTQTLMKMVSRIAQTADNPEEVAQLAVKLAQMDEPDLRYPVGRRTKNAIRLKSLLPWKWFERATLKKVGFRNKT